MRVRRRSVRRATLRRQRGAVTAETAMVLPILALFAVGLAWLVGIGVAHVRCVDAAREAARAVARGDAGEARSLGERIAPDDARIDWERDGATVVVTVRARVRGPFGLFAGFGSTTVTAAAVAALEPGVGGG